MVPSLILSLTNSHVLLLLNVILKSSIWVFSKLILLREECRSEHMAAKLFEPLNDERRQIGCMTGFIHLFEQPNNTPLPNCITHSMTLQGNSQLFRGSCEMEQATDSYHQHGLEMRSNRNSNDRLGLYTESSRASCSSSRSSSFSSVDYSKIMHPEPCSYDRILFPESPLLDRSLSHSSSSWRMRQQSLDLDDEVKDLPCSSGEESILSKHQDSPRPLQATLLDESKGNRYERIELGCYGHDTKERQGNCDMSDEVARLSLGSSTESSYVLNSRMRMHHNQRKPSIVEKLMGLEAMPRTGCITPNNKSSVSTVSGAQRCLKKDHKWKNGDLVMKPISSSRILIEPAPWKQPDVTRSSTKAAVKSKQCAASSELNGFMALYSKFEGRYIEFQRSSKDLKTLKQMLDAVQRNGTCQEENKDKEVLRKIHQNVCASAVKGEQESTGKTLKSPIVIMKPFRLVAKSDIAASSVIRSEGVQHLSKPQGDHSVSRRKALSNARVLQGPNTQNGYRSPRNNPSEKKLTRTQPTMPQPVSKEKKTNSAASLGSGSPKMQHKKFDYEKKPRPATTSSNATKLSVQKSKHSRESYLSGEKSQLKYSVTQQCNAQQSGLSTESKDTYSGNDSEVTSKLRLDHIDGSRSPARKVARPMLSSIRKHKPSRISNEDTLLGHSTTTASEQPSPVSVLDPAAYKEDPTSPLIRKMTSRGTSELVTHMSPEKLKHIEDLVQELNGVSSTYKKSNTDFIASLCMTTNPDQRYIFKILLASGFLFLDFESNGSSCTFQPHISGHPINPELFFVLEQTKSCALLTEDRQKLSASKSHRRLIFDCCNEILTEQLAPSSMRRKLARRSISARRLLNDMCDRIDHLQAKYSQIGEIEHREEGHDEDDTLKRILYEDMILKSDNWGNSEKCIAEVVLDIERMLFKDLVKEVVCDEAVLSGLRSKAGRSCERKLHFNKV